MTTRFPYRTAPTWMLEHRGKIIAAIAGGLTLTIALVGAAAWQSSDGKDTEARTATVNSPASRENVRGPVFEGTEAPSIPSGIGAGTGSVGAQVGAGVTSAAIQPSAAEPKFPASRENVRGPAFEGTEAPSIPSGIGAGTGSVGAQVGAGVTSAAIQPSAAEPKFPASRENVRGPVFEGTEVPSIPSGIGAGTGSVGAQIGAGVTSAAIQPSTKEPRVLPYASNARGSVFD